LLGGSILHRVGLRPLICGGLAAGALGVGVVAFGFPHGLGWVVAGMAITGFGMGSAISVASTAILNNVPAHRAGMASSVEEVSYEFGGLLAVAMLGSLGAAMYGAFLPVSADVPALAREGFAQAQQVAREAGPGEWFAGATAAYDRSYQIVLLVITAVLAVGAALIARLLRGRAGSREGAADRVK
ncbi:TPA: MFS transporter, partial [Stenotrophomonas maltophilia]|nr:MFS transporter [Stenotrophomonas maltophilia]HEL7732174.1 MFS transporter [Stenotrophomonas maltophilia]